MNYRHAYHAGNFADVMKHTALIAALDYLAKKDKPFRVIDTHAGRGLYDLSGHEAVRTREAQTGVARLGAAAGMPDALRRYAEVAGSFGADRYPGSPLIAQRVLRLKDRLVAIERHAEEYEALATALKPYANARTIQGDGYARLAALLPPPERRGLVLIDPPYEAEDEFARAGEAFAAAWQRFATGVILIWLPIKRRADADALAGEIRSRSGAKLLLLTLDVGRPPDTPPERLSQCGLLVANPPYGFDDTMRAMLAYLAEHLAQGPGASWRVDALSASADL
ncbi:MAG: 23S rRNA (adenine(2030)-N(6))-methyltransferase RlmJ [Rhizomicrobium sp.]